MNLDKLTRKELLDLKREVEQKLVKLEKQHRADAIKAAEQAAREYGFTFDDLLQETGKRASRKTVRKGEPKYAHPDDKSVTWTGKGRKPRWFTEAIAAGWTPEQLEI
ncbi:DNA-binding protein H-NS [Salinihabitans flavidus]|uniref:DNA-binding protein H-NS n=1 Tax=Salinihabitans flavidus TaxID=569882 RepID=A0A1H8VH50_9RHOB|nr:H-NS histone family protein [Salinihabitans flavidus]SEP14735.1 DNA-binding protein H-NS [Salinihabitans flavidus]